MLGSDQQFAGHRKGWGTRHPGWVGERFVVLELAYGRVEFVAGLKTRDLGAEKGRSVLRPYGRRLRRDRYQVTRTRYLRVAVPFLSTGIWNWAAQAEVLVNL